VQAHTLGEVDNLGTAFCWGFIPGQSFQFLLKLIYIWQIGAKYYLAQLNTVYLYNEQSYEQLLHHEIPEENRQ